MSKYRKKPVVIEAVQLSWSTWQEMCKFADVGRIEDGRPEGYMGAGQRCCMRIPTLEGVMNANEGDWIIRGTQGELYPCKPDIFAATYEAVNDG